VTAVAGAPPWPPEWLASLRRRRAVLWRGVEAQHRIATMKVVDSVDEQDLLEAVLERSKPPLPPQAEGLHYLVATPFRYLSAWPSRFRGSGEPGIWYGAERLDTACAEVGYWRWRFAMDSDGLRDAPVVSELTFFEAAVSGPVVDLGTAPWSAFEDRWMDPADYSGCQGLARAAREAGAAWIRYRSVRDPRHHRCGAVLEPGALTLGDLTRQITWACKVTAAAVLMRPLGIGAVHEPLEFAFAR
jgi:hypothetical protein